MTIRRCDAKWQNPLPTSADFDIRPYVAKGISRSH